MNRDRNDTCNTDQFSSLFESAFAVRLCQVRYTNSATRIPEFQIEPELALELLMAANFLDC